MKQCHFILTAAGVIFSLLLTTYSWAQSTLSDELIVTATRLGSTMTGASVTVIEEKDIRNSPASQIFTNKKSGSETSDVYQRAVRKSRKQISLNYVRNPQVESLQALFSTFEVCLCQNLFI